MKRYYILLLPLLFLLSCSQNSKNEGFSFKTYDLNRKVKSVQILTYEAESKFGEIVKGDLAWNPWESYNVVFNKDGYATEVTNFDDEGNIYGKDIFTYDNDGRLIKVSSYDKNGRSKRESNYYYNRERLDSVIRYENEEKEVIWILSKKSKSEYVYDGKKVIEERHLEDGKVSFTYKYEYFDNGKLAKEVIYDADGTVVIEADFDKVGRLVKQTGATRTIEIEYNKQGLKSHEKYTRKKYDNNTYRITYFEYEYDKKNNWIKRISYEGESRKPDKISERVINY